MSAVCIIPNCGKSAPAGEAFCAWHRKEPRAVFIAVAAEPVAWRVKDFADGWSLFGSETEALLEVVATGGLMQALYTEAAPSTGVSDQVPGRTPEHLDADRQGQVPGPEPQGEGKGPR